MLRRVLSRPVPSRPLSGATTLKEPLTILGYDAPGKAGVEFVIAVWRIMETFRALIY